LVTLIAHLWKWLHQPDRRSRSWRATILEQRQRLADLASGGVLRSHAEAILADAYEEAVELASAETGMPREQFHGLIFQTLEGHLRAILGTLTVEEINNDRQSFAQKLTSEAAVDLEKMGIGLDALTIQEISDEEGYLDALGKRRTAEVKRDAEIGQAEANRD